MTSRFPHDPDAGNPPGRPRTGAELDALLDGGTSGDASLDRVLAAARAPAHADELIGLGTVRDAVTDAALGAPVTPLSRSRRALARVGAATAATKIAALSAVAAAAIGGVVLVGAHGHLPGQHHGPSGSDSPTPSVSPGRSPGSAPSGSAGSPGPSNTFLPSPNATGGSGSTPVSTSVPASLPALCRQWLALPTGPSQIKDGSRFDRLVRSAGGSDQVTGYCRRLVGGATSTPTGTRTASGTSSRPSSPSVTRTASPTRARSGSTRTSTDN